MSVKCAASDLRLIQIKNRYGAIHAAVSISLSYSRADLVATDHESAKGKGYDNCDCLDTSVQRTTSVAVHRTMATPAPEKP
ncbi:hypothetical protein D3C75_911240 [compost metagenome]